LIEEHEKAVPKYELQHLVKQGCRPSPDVFAHLCSFLNHGLSMELGDILLCPLCDFSLSAIDDGAHVIASDLAVMRFSRDVYTEIRDHVASHLERLALLSLPEKGNVEAESSAKQASHLTLEERDDDDLAAVSLLFDDPPEGVPESMEDLPPVSKSWSEILRGWTFGHTCDYDPESDPLIGHFMAFALQAASFKGHQEIVQLLLDRGADINTQGGNVGLKSKSQFGRTPLSWAAGNGHEGVVKLLLETGKVDVESKHRFGRTPLSWAAGNGHEVVKPLLETRQESEDLTTSEAAIANAKLAVAATPDDHPDRAGQLNNLSKCLSSRYDRTGNLQDLEDAITNAELAVAATPDDQPDRAGYLKNLSDGLSSRYNRTGNLQDLEDAITNTQLAVAVTPGDHPNHAGYLNNLSNHLSSRYERTGSLQDLEAAITNAGLAVAATPDDHPDHAGRLNNLSKCLSNRYDRTGT
jgi:hypothetical protein